jgi:tRNA A37 threonylcarbamoyladenosine dehydratase
LEVRAMLHEQFSRLALLLGEAAIEKLQRARVAVFGLGGVGSYTVEALARSGVGAFLLVDSDIAVTSNINRQLHATHETVGRKKTELMAGRVLAINPAAKVEAREDFCTPENIPEVLAGQLDYIVDAIDTVSAKLALVQEAQRLGIPIISAMGAGNKLDATRFEVADIFRTSVCPLCRVMRTESKKRGITALKVVYSKEPPIKTGVPGENGRRSTPGSAAFVTGVAGLILAGEVIGDLTRG